MIMPIHSLAGLKSELSNAIKGGEISPETMEHLQESLQHIKSENKAQRSSLEYMKEVYAWLRQICNLESWARLRTFQSDEEGTGLQTLMVAVLMQMQEWLELQEQNNTPNLNSDDFSLDKWFADICKELDLSDKEMDKIRLQAVAAEQNKSTDAFLNSLLKFTMQAPSLLKILQAMCEHPKVGSQMIFTSPAFKALEKLAANMDDLGIELSSLLSQDQAKTWQMLLDVYKDHIADVPFAELVQPQQPMPTVSGSRVAFTPRPGANTKSKKDDNADRLIQQHSVQRSALLDRMMVPGWTQGQLRPKDS